MKALFLSTALGVFVTSAGYVYTDNALKAACSVPVTDKNLELEACSVCKPK